MTKRPKRTTVQNPALAVLRTTIENIGMQVQAYLDEAAKLPEAQQAALLAKADSLMDDQQQFVDLLKRMTARDAATADKAARTAADHARITRLVPARSAASI